MPETMAGQTPPPESTQDQIQRLLRQDRSTRAEVGSETSGDPKQEPEPAEAESDAPEDATGGDPNAQTEGDEAPDVDAVHSLADLAKHLEVDEEALAKHLRVAGRNGQEVSLHDVLTAYRAPAPEAAEVERSRTRLAELEGKEADVQRAAEELRQTARALAAQLKSREPDWAALKADPVAHATARLEWMAYERQLEQAAAQYRAAAEQQMSDQRRQVDEFRRGEARKLQAAVPEWKDPKVFEADLGKVEQYLVTQGIKPEEIANLTDHRDWLIARKAMQFDALQGKKPALLAKIKQLPRVITPGASSGGDRGTRAAAAKEETARMDRFRDTGKVEDAAELIRSRLAASSKRAAGRALASGRRS